MDRKYYVEEITVGGEVVCLLLVLARTKQRHTGKFKSMHYYHVNWSKILGLIRRTERILVNNTSSDVFITVLIVISLRRPKYIFSIMVIDLGHRAGTTEYLCKVDTTTICIDWVDLSVFHCVFFSFSYGPCQTKKCRQAANRILL